MMKKLSNPFVIESSDTHNPDDIAHAQRFLDAAHRHLSTVPRHRIEPIGFELDILVALDADKLFKRAYVYEKDYPRETVGEVLVSHASDLWYGSRSDLSEAQRSEQIRRLGIEVMFWRNYRVPGLREVLKFDEYWYYALALAMHTPEAIPYIDAGITDTELIKHCLLADVDIDTAVAVNNSRSN